MNNWDIAKSPTYWTSSRRGTGSRLCVVLSLMGLALIGVLIVLDRGAATAKTWKRPSYNYTYPFSPIERKGDETRMHIAIVADLDHNSKHENGYWISYLLKGHLVRDGAGMYRVDWDDSQIELHSYIAEKGRGLELSELQVFNGKLYSVDDRTGIVYEIVEDEAIPRWILTDGDGNDAKGFKAEWMAVKDEHLWVGGMGKEWTTPKGEVVNLNPQWVKVISVEGTVEHVNWINQYDALRLSLDMPAPGYVIHESATWSDHHQRWFFLPRKASKERYDDTEDEKRGVNHLLKVDESFSTIEIAEAGHLNPLHGFSSFKFVPDTSDQHIIALKTMETAGQTRTFVTVIDLDGTVRMDLTLVGDYKYEGLEFI